MTVITPMITFASALHNALNGQLLLFQHAHPKFPVVAMQPETIGGIFSSSPNPVDQRITHSLKRLDLSFRRNTFGDEMEETPRNWARERGIELTL